MKKYIATFDIGTTAIKGVLIDFDLQVKHTAGIEIATIFDGDHKEQDPHDWYNSFCKISKEFTDLVTPSDIAGIVMSGQMQDTILLDKSGLPVQRAILYSDARAESQVSTINQALGKSTVSQVTGNPFDASIPFAKLLWISENASESLEKTHKIVISSKDAIIARICGTFVTDVTSASTSGLMDLSGQKSQKAWKKEWLEAMGLSPILLPTLLTAQEEAGRVHSQGASETGFAVETPVYAGTGDAGATTLASGISGPGEYNINLGTTGWVATVSQSTLSNEGVFNLAAMPPGYIINVVPFFNAGNVHKWISGVLYHENGTSHEGIDKYAYGNTLLENSVPGSNGLYCLPYLVGERFPVVDSAVRGAYIGITPETGKNDLIRASLEGVAYSIRQGMDILKAQPTKVSLIGGGATVPSWCQLLSEILGVPVDVYRNAEFAPAQAIAASALIAQKITPSYRDFMHLLKTECDTYNPIPQNVDFYQEAYKGYLKIYPALKNISV